MIQFQTVNKRYSNKQTALSNINFALEKGEMAFLTGHSGAGKSTLLKLIACLERPTSGDVFVNDHHLNQLSNRQIPAFRRQIGIIFQNPHLLSDRNVIENVMLPLEMAKLPYQENIRNARAALDKVGLLHKETAHPETLSCGEQQRVNIARAIVTRPPIILADEPTGNLDPSLSRDIIHLFEQFNQLGITILIASHDLHLIHELNKYRLLELHAGCLV